MVTVYAIFFCITSASNPQINSCKLFENPLAGIDIMYKSADECKRRMAQYNQPTTTKNGATMGLVCMAKPTATWQPVK
jgi:hypothetical protein